VEDSQKQDAEILRSMLTHYRESFGEQGHVRKPADDKIVARCLAAGHIEQLGQTLRDMKSDGLRPKPKDGWFVTLFCNKIHGIPPELTASALKTQFERKQPAREYDTVQPGQLFQQPQAAGARF
jgi:hypothetical protein